MKSYTIRTKPEKKIFKKMKIYLIFIVIYLILLFLVWLLFISPVFQIKQIEFQGLEQLKKDDLLSDLRQTGREISQKSFLLRLLPFEKILFWENKKIAEIIPRRNNLISEAYSSVNFLKRFLIITIQERKGEVVWCQKFSGDCFWIDKLGIAFREAPFTEGSIFTRVDDSSNRILIIGKSVLENDLIENFFAVKNFLSNLDIKSYNFNFSKPENQEIEAVLTDGPKIYFSLRFKPDEFLKPLLELKNNFPKIQYIDLRVKNRIYYQS